MGIREWVTCSRLHGQTGRPMSPVHGRPPVGLNRFEDPPDLGGVADYSPRSVKKPVHRPNVTAGDPERGCLAQSGGASDYSPGWWPVALPGGSRGGVYDRRKVSVRTGPPRVLVRRHATGSSLRDLRWLDRELARDRPDRILIQYVPHAFGWKAMNLPFVAWALIRRVRRRDDVRVMFHEVAFPWVRRPLRHNVLAAVNRVMAAVLVRACTRAYVTIPGWVPLLRRLGAGRLPIAWTPVPSNVPEEASTSAVAARRAELTLNDPTVRLACHFGTYGPSVTRALGPVLRELLGRRPDVRVVLLGAGGDRWRGELAGGRADWHARVIAPGSLSAPLIAEYLRAMRPC